MEKLFEECTLGNVRIKNRIIRSATHDGLADEYGAPSDKLIEKYVTLAKNDVGCIIAGYAMVNDVGMSNYPRMLKLYGENIEDNYKKLTCAVHEYNTPIIAQIAHCGRQTSSKKIGMKKVAPTAKRHLLYPDKAREMTVKEIEDTVIDFANAIIRAKEYGFDGAELHGGHGYLLHDFISANGNKRKDGYGKNIAGRCRIIKEIIEKARESVGDFPIWIKISATDKRKKGMRVDYAVEVAKLLKEYGIDAIEVSCGSVQDGMNTMRSKRFPMKAIFKYREPLASMPKFFNKVFLACACAVNPLIPQPKPLENFNIPSALAIKKAVDIDVIAVGGIKRLDDMKTFVNDGIDAVSMCRPFICEPNLAKKLINGKSTESKCVMCNYCGLVIEKEPTKCLYGKIKDEKK